MDISSDMLKNPALSLKQSSSKNLLVKQRLSSTISSSLPADKTAAKKGRIIKTKKQDQGGDYLSATNPLMMASLEQEDPYQSNVSGPSTALKSRHSR